MGFDIGEIISKDFKQSIQCFDIRENENKKAIFSCCVDNCDKKYTDKSAAIRHIRTGHKEIYNAINTNKVNQTNKAQMNPTLELRVRVNPKEIVNACVDLITVNALPLSALEYPAFKKILEPYVIALKLKGIDLIINRRNIKDEINKRALKIKKLIKREVRHKMVSIMTDIASRYNRSILGVNVAYMVSGQIKVRTLGMHVIRCSQTAKNIVNIIKMDLSEYGIQLKQVMSVTTDNGKNFIKAVSLLDLDFQAAHVALHESNDLDGSDDDDSHIDEDIFDSNYYEDLLAKVRAEFEESCYTDMIHGIACAAHCLHLVIINAIKKTNSIKLLLDKSRSLAKKLRTPKIRALLESSNLNAATIDVVTRWNSLYSMVILFLYVNFVSNFNCVHFFFIVGSLD